MTTIDTTQQTAQTESVADLSTSFGSGLDAAQAGVAQDELAIAGVDAIRFPAGVTPFASGYAYSGGSEQDFTQDDSTAGVVGMLPKINRQAGENPDTLPPSLEGPGIKIMARTPQELDLEPQTQRDQRDYGGHTVIPNAGAYIERNEMQAARKNAA